MITAAALIGILAGLLRGGRLSSLSRQRLRAIALLPAAWLCEALSARGAAAWAAGALGSPGSAPLILFLLAVIQFSAVFIFIGLNIEKPGLGLLLVGSIMNGAVILANGGRMPVGQLAGRFGEAALQRISEAPHYLLASGTEPLVFLGDWLPFWSLGWYMVSIGDFFIAAGAILLCDALLRPTTLTLSRLPKVESGAEYVYTKERFIKYDERRIGIYGLYRQDLRQGQERQKDDRPAGIQRPAHDRGGFAHHGAGHRQYYPDRQKRGH